MASYANEFIGYDEKDYNSLQRAIGDYSEEITKKINSLKTVVASLKGNWMGADADAYTKQLESIITESVNKTKNLYNGMSSSFESTYKEWKNKQSQ